MKLFGTDGIRGRANKEPLKPETVLRVGLALGRTLRRAGGRGMVLIGKDTRLSGYLFESALTSGLCSMGMNVTLVGPIPTPGVAFLTRALRLDAGIVLSASHNPFEDNGIKVFSGEGRKLPDEVEADIEKLVRGGGQAFRNRPQGEGIGRAFRLEDATGRYIEYVKSTIPKGMTLDGLRVVVDCANGAAYKVTPAVLAELGAEVIAINADPDGTNINAACGSLHLDVLREAVLAHGAHVGVAHDGDADRALFIDEKGGVVDGDHVLGLWGAELKELGRLPGNTVVATVMSNLGLERFLDRRGIALLRTRVGDRYVTERMWKDGLVLGGEQSGHIVMTDCNTTGDGPVTALHLISLMKKSGRPLSELAGEIELYPQVLLGVEVARRDAYHDNRRIAAAVAAAEERLGSAGRILVRASGTEPKVRVMIEGEDAALIRELAEGIAEVIRAEMG
jgi:phosphoglucosamine mutase